MKRASRLLLALLVAVPAACGRGSAEIPADLIDRETFVQVYVDLRRAATAAGRDTISPAQREEILARHGVEARQLVDFADVHGRDVEFMRAVWDDVDARISPDPAAADGR